MQMSKHQMNASAMFEAAGSKSKAIHLAKGVALKSEEKACETGEDIAAVAEGMKQQFRKWYILLRNQILQI